jgi:peroxiredoxin
MDEKLLADVRRRAATTQPSNSGVCLMAGLWLAGWCLGVLLPARLSAGEFNEVLSIGDPAPAWVDLPGTDGKRHSLADLRGKEVVVFVVTCASCPTAVDYEDRIQALAQRYASPDSKVAVVAVCVNRVEEDRLPALTRRAKDKKFVFPYLYDESQQIARQYGALFTPEFFVLDRDRKIAYMGAFDDSTDPAGVTARYVEDAIAALLKGDKPAVTETIARGCRVRYARERRP